MLKELKKSLDLSNELYDISENLLSLGIYFAMTTPNETPKKPRRPISESKTRWFSTYMMLHWFHDAYDSLVEVLPNMEKISDVEFPCSTMRVLDDVHSLLQPLADATKLVEGDNYPTLAWIVEIRFLLLKHLRSYKAKSKPGTSFCTCLLDQVEERFGTLPDVVWMAALFTPSLRDSQALDGKRENAWKLIKARYSEVQIPPATSRRTDDEIVSDAGDTSLAALRLRFSKPKTITHDDDYAEFKRYKALPGSPDPTLDWWRANETLFPRLAIVAKKVLGVVASSGPVERLFQKKHLHKQTTTTQC